ncbi:Collagen alpha-5(VI) chain [Frankliniella fusca]|uniref:Collagen alpha-5(VI) chain n=1 Tax=Frankliniella fusca TaxID=407009 RepID=A0AAE1HPX3_9NEOP|nr:Collagen alpha-5(VI) chain [Frankliniella fusca]
MKRLAMNSDTIQSTLHPPALPGFKAHLGYEALTMTCVYYPFCGQSCDECWDNYSVAATAAESDGGSEGGFGDGDQSSISTCSNIFSCKCDACTRLSSCGCDGGAPGSREGATCSERCGEVSRTPLGRTPAPWGAPRRTRRRGRGSRRRRARARRQGKESQFRVLGQPSAGGPERVNLFSTGRGVGAVRTRVPRCQWCSLYGHHSKQCTVLLSLLGDRAGVPPGTPQPRAVYIGQAAIGGSDGESATRRPHWSASAQRCNQARSVPGDGSRLQEGSGRSVTVRSPETTADGCRISGGPGLEETPLQAEEGPGQLQRWGSEPGSVARTEGGGTWEADDRGRHGSALRSGAPSARPQVGRTRRRRRRGARRSAPLAVTERGSGADQGVAPGVGGQAVVGRACLVASSEHAAPEGAAAAQGGSGRVIARESEGLHGAGHPSPCDEASRTQPNRTEECLAGGSNAVAASAVQPAGQGSGAGSDEPDVPAGERPRGRDAATGPNLIFHRDFLQSEIAERSSPAADAVAVAVQGDRARLSRGCTDGQTQQTVRDRPVAAGEGEQRTSRAHGLVEGVGQLPRSLASIGQMPRSPLGIGQQPRSPLSGGGANTPVLTVNNDKGITQVNCVELNVAPGAVTGHAWPSEVDERVESFARWEAVLAKERKSLDASYAVRLRTTSEQDKSILYRTYQQEIVQIECQKQSVMKSLMSFSNNNENFSVPQLCRLLDVSIRLNKPYR